tara:strand:+ start:667 stop:1071 length:405 start_codon:yes stop_codon:yes gene_type:complete
MNKNIDLKKVFNKLFESSEEKSSNLINLHQQASTMLEKASKTPKNWANIFQAIEEFRNDLLTDDRQDSTATESQMALVLPLIAYFVLVLETDVLAYPQETKIFINLVKDNFTSQKQIDKLERFLNILHPTKDFK